jgi:hypothetical protein
LVTRGNNLGSTRVRPLLVLMAVFAVSAAPAVAQWRVPLVLSGARAEGTEPEPLRALREAADAPARLAAAKSLLRDDMADRDRAAVGDVLGTYPSESASAIVRAAASMTECPAWVLEPLVQLVRPGDVMRVDVLDAMSSVRTRESARALLAAGKSATVPEVRLRAFSALARLSGRDDLTPDAAAWDAWLSSMDRLTPSEWRAELSLAIAARADRLGGVRADLAQRLGESIRKLHVSMTGEERSKLVAALLVDRLDELRQVGIDLIGRELSAGNRVDPAVGTAAISLLENANPAVRTSGAVLVNQLVPDGASTAVGVALARETDPSVAAALLAASVRWPAESNLGPALRWLASEGVAQPAAFDACWALFRAGVLVDPALRADVLRLARAVPTERETSSAIMLRGSIGDETDLEAIRLLLGSQSAPQRLAAADSLSRWSVFVDGILDAAAADAALVDIAVRSLVLHRQTAAGLRAARAIVPRASEGRRATLVRVAEVLPASELLEGSRVFADEPPMQEAVLGTMALPSRIASERYSEAQSQAIARGLLELAALRLSLGKPAESLQALQAFDEIDRYARWAELAAIRTRAMLELDRIDLAVEVDGPADAWIDALETSVDRPHAPEILKAIERRFADTLTPDQDMRVGALRAKIRDDAAKR